LCRAELTGRNRADCVAEPRAEYVDSELLALVAIDACKADLQQDLRFRRRNIYVEQVHDLTGSRRDRHSAVRGREVVHCTAEKNHAIILRHAHVLARKLCPQFAANGIELVVDGKRARTNGDIEELTASALIPDD
jgi:hypothetical protein